MGVFCVCVWFVCFWVVVCGVCAYVYDVVWGVCGFDMCVWCVCGVSGFVCV
jgi:hypothetical protein